MSSVTSSREESQHALWGSPGCWMGGRWRDDRLQVLWGSELANWLFCCRCFILSGFVVELLDRLRETKDSALLLSPEDTIRHPDLPNHLAAGLVSLPIIVCILHFGEKPQFREVFWMLTVKDSCCLQSCSPSLCHPFYGPLIPAFWAIHTLRVKREPPCLSLSLTA